MTYLDTSHHHYICFYQSSCRKFNLYFFITGPIVDPLLSWITELNNVSANVNWIILRNLKAAASYQFRVSAVNSVGEGSPSDPSNVVQLPQERMYLFVQPLL